MPQTKFQNLTTQKMMQRIINQTNAAEGTTLPPRQSGPFRVPLVSGVKILNTQSFLGGTQFIVGWVEPTGQTNLIDHYNLYASGLTDNGLVGPVSSNQSPATIRLQTTAAQTVTIFVQTILKSGLAGSIESSPSVTGQTIAGQVNSSDIPAGSLPISVLATGTDGALIGFNNTGVPSMLAPGASGTILVSTGTSSLPSYQTVDFFMGKRSSVADTNYNIQASDDIVAYTSITATRTATLPNATLLPVGKYYWLKDESGSVTGLITIVLATTGGQTIDGAATKVINSAYGSLMVYGNGSNWFLI